jgi:hypothetical protein
MQAKVSSITNMIVRKVITEAAGSWLIFLLANLRLLHMTDGVTLAALEFEALT